MPRHLKAALLTAGAFILLPLSAASLAEPTVVATIDPLSPSALARSNCTPQTGRPDLLVKMNAVMEQRRSETRPFRLDGATGAVPGVMPLLTGLGTPTLGDDRHVPQVRAYLDQGLRLAYGFNHQAAQASFKAAQALDPNCILCFWGEAFVLGPNINAPMEPGAMSQALTALSKAEALLPKANERERGLVIALRHRYSADATVDPMVLENAYADAMGRLVAAFPRDAEIATLAAEAMMNTQPWDYWEAAGTRLKGRGPQIRALLETALALKPDHSGALHLYVHLMEASADPRSAEPHADRLAAQKSTAGHLAHMPGHIYHRIGRYADSIRVNRAAVAADEALFANVAQSGAYPTGYYPHNVHFILVGAQMGGDGATAIQAADKLALLMKPVGRDIPAWVQAILAAPWLARAQFASPADVVALPMQVDALPFVQGQQHYARAVAFAALGRPEEAEKEVSAMDRLAGHADVKAMEAAGVPGPAVLTLAGHVARSRIAQARGNLDQAIVELHKAREIEQVMPYMEPPHWYYPVSQSLGGRLLQAGRFDEAEAAFRAALAQAPNNGWSLYGITLVAERKGDKALAEAAKRDLERAWIGPREQLDPARL